MLTSRISDHLHSLSGPYTRLKFEPACRRHWNKKTTPESIDVVVNENDLAGSGARNPRQPISSPSDGYVQIHPKSLDRTFTPK